MPACIAHFDFFSQITRVLFSETFSSMDDSMSLRAGSVSMPTYSHGKHWCVHNISNVTVSLSLSPSIHPPSPFILSFLCPPPYMYLSVPTHVNSSSKSVLLECNIIHVIHVHVHVPESLWKQDLVCVHLPLSFNNTCTHAHMHTCTHTLQLTIPFQSVEAITKEKTTLVIPNAIQISTSADKYGFSSLVNRDITYNVIFKCWQNSLLDHV